MFEATTSLFAADVGQTMLVGGLLVVSLVSLLTLAILLKFGALWFQAYMSGADVSVMSLIGMSFRQVKPSMIVTAKIMGRQAGLNIDRQQGMSTARLEAHFLAGGDVMHVLRAIIAAHRAGIDLDFDRAAAIDLAGRDVLDAVRTSVSPKVIDCPEPQRQRQDHAQRGREKWCRAADPRAGDRPHESGSIDRRSDRGNDHCPRWPGNHYRDRIRPNAHGSDGNARPHFQGACWRRGLDANTAFEIVSIDIADIDVGENIGARLQSDQAEADTRMARARAEARRAEAIACQQEMKAKVTQSRARLVLAEAEIPAALAVAFRAGQLHARRQTATQTPRRGDKQLVVSTPAQITNPGQSRVERVQPADPSRKVREEHE